MWVNSAGFRGTWSCSKPCDIPTGELTFSNGWADFYTCAGAPEYPCPTQHKWLQSLSPGPSTINFGGRTVTEGDPGGGGPDTCHFVGSRYDPLESISGGTWEVDANNEWGDDFVGWIPSAVLYYRLNERAPCGTRFPQRMVIACATSNPQYVTNELTMDIYPEEVSSGRADQRVQRVWP